MMTRRSFVSRGIATLLVLIMGVVSLPAQDAASRIRARLPEIDAFKAAGVVGENNKGLLQARTELTEAQEALVAAENADRLELYKLVARRQGKSVEEVGEQRAVRIAQQALSGVWLQNAQDEWYKKP